VIGDRQLSDLTTAVGTRHEATSTPARRTAAAWGSSLAPRRRVLAAGAGTIGAVTLAACGKTRAAASATPATASSSAAVGSYPGELATVALSAALEQLVVAGYDLVLRAIRAGTFGVTPPAFAAFATAVRSQHADHAQTWNAVLTGAGHPAVSGVPLSGAATALAPFHAATTVPAAARAALGLEQAATATCLAAVGVLTDPAGLRVAATIAPVEAQHASILLLLLGNAPVPASQLATAGALKTSALTV
jgi:hypothetical protein